MKRIAAKVRNECEIPHSRSGQNDTFYLKRPQAPCARPVTDRLQGVSKAYRPPQSPASALMCETAERASDDSE